MKDEGKTVTEFCSNCETEIEMKWDVETRGYKAFCPVCGERLMLCYECQRRGPDGEYTDDCDYDSETDTCKFNKKTDTETPGAESGTRGTEPGTPGAELGTRGIGLDIETIPGKGMWINNIMIRYSNGYQIRVRCWIPEGETS